MLTVFRYGRLIRPAAIYSRKENIMGEYSEMLIEGEQCSGGCGVMFEEGHGYPVLCKECWANASKEERKAYQRARNKEL